MPKQLTQDDRELRAQALRDTNGAVPEAVELLAKRGHKTDYRALSSWSIRNRKLWEAPAKHPHEVLRRIVVEADVVAKDLGPVALAARLGTIKAMAEEALR